jgi:hypothetical protein
MVGDEESTNDTDVNGTDDRPTGGSKPRDRE